MLEDFAKQQKQNAKLYIQLQLKKEMFALLEKQEKDVKEQDVVNGQENALVQNAEFYTRDVHGEEKLHALKENALANGQTEDHFSQRTNKDMLVDKRDVTVQKLFAMETNVSNKIQKHSGLEKEFANILTRNVHLLK